MPDLPCRARLHAGWVVAGLLIGAPGMAAAGTGPDPRDLVTQSVSYLRDLLGNEPGTVVVVDHQAEFGSDRVGLRFTLADVTGSLGGQVNRTLAIALVEGRVLVDERAVGHYAPGGAFQAAWRDLVYEATRRETADFIELAHRWEPDGLQSHETVAAGRLHTRLAALNPAATQATTPRTIPQAEAGGLSVSLDNLENPAALESTLREAIRRQESLQITIPGGSARLGDYTVGSSERVQGHLLLLRGDANVYGTLVGNLVTLDGNIVVHPGGVVEGDVLSLGGLVQDAGGEIRGEIRTLAPTTAPGQGPAPARELGGLALVLRNAAGLVGVFLTLTALGFGLVLFSRSNLDVVADTITHSFGRAFMVGLLAEMLLLPTFGMLVVGLLLSVVGVLLIPFAVLAYFLLLFVGVVGGYLAAAHAVGEGYVRRRMALGHVVGSPNSYRFIVTGLALMLAFWGGWVIFGWIPFAGALVKGAAIVITWLLVTVGFGATLLSRAGVREAFTGRIVPPEALTDEYLWATPQFGVPAAKRPPKQVK